ncbi:P-loop NTPase fold protein [Lewinella cohaerens]|uniref:P-loop NTPase fold protein n=1 Tax=Lewinella cohaerens TaxID=70995 RepID=UPI000370F492|nr:P-loop NTPase fold protein [Lewinella cohaerens]
MLDVIKNYLTSEIDEYGLLINGEWGSGKTFFIENTLAQDIKPLEIFYFTVNGVSSTAELHRTIVSKAITNHLKLDSFLSFGTRAGKVIKGMPKVVAVLDSLSFSDFHFPDKVIVIIDDLERIADSYSYRQLFGYISRTFLKNPKFKTIIIGDISRPRIEGSEFRVIKEKYIKWIVDFESDFDTVLDTMLTKYKDEEKFSDFIVENKSAVQYLFKRHKIKNYRTLAFFLEVCVTASNTFYDKFNELSKSILLFIFIFSIEYKLGRTSQFKSPAHLPQQVKRSGGDSFLFSEIVFERINKMTGAVEETPQENDQPPSTLDVFIKSFESYFKEDPNDEIGYKGEYHFFESLYTYVTTGKLDKTAFVAECESLANHRKRSQEETVREQIDEDVVTITRYKTLSFVELSEAINRFLEKLEGLNIADAIKGFNFLFFFSESGMITTQSTEELEQIFRNYLNDYSFEEGLSLQQKTKGINFRMLGPSMWEERQDVYNNLLERYNAYKNVLKRQNAELKLEGWGNNMILDIKIVFSFCTADQIADRVIQLLNNRDLIEQLEGEFDAEFNYSNVRQHYFHLLQKLERLSERFGEVLDENSADRIDLFFLRSFRATIDAVIEKLRPA